MFCVTCPCGVRSRPCERRCYGQQRGLDRHADVGGGAFGSRHLRRVELLIGETTAEYLDHHGLRFVLINSSNLPLQGRVKRAALISRIDCVEKVTSPPLSEIKENSATSRLYWYV